MGLPWSKPTHNQYLPRDNLEALEGMRKAKRESFRLHSCTQYARNKKAAGRRLVTC